MEVFFVRLPHLSELIFDELDNQNLSKCREVCESWKDYLGVQKFLHIRFIKEKLKKFDVPKQPWKEVFEKSNTTTIIRLAICVDQMPLETYLTDSKGLDPLHFVAASGNLFLFKEILEKASIKEPRNIKGTAPIHYAAFNGKLDVCKTILEYAVDKNPRNYKGMTALYYVAINGNFEIYKLIMKQVEDKIQKEMTDIHLFMQLLPKGTCSCVK